MCNISEDVFLGINDGFDSEGIISSLASLRVVSYSLTAQIAYAVGEFAVCLEFTRCVISLSECAEPSSETALMWALRGGAFVMTGK